MNFYCFTRSLTALLLSLSLSACEPLTYYSQALSGQLTLLKSRQDIATLLEQTEVAPALRAQLEQVLELRDFAEEELLLPVKQQYSAYADLQRDYVVWNVFAAPELSLQSKTWCYPLVGCAAYRGYFKESAAKGYAAELAEQGYDTHVGGVAAYSTLGWLDDPVLNTFVYRNEAALADLIFHELAHQLLFIPGDTVFNESFATTVAREGVRRWMLQKGDEAQYATYLQSGQQQADFIALVSDYRQQLGSVYSGADNDPAKRAAKAALITELRQAYVALKPDTGGSLPYAHWINGPLNNAKLNTVSLYYQLVPGLERWLAQDQFDLTAFYARCLQLAELSNDERQQLLDPAG